MNSRTDTTIKPKEYEVLNAISQDSLITQSGLALRLGMAVGSVNWYIKRLTSRGYVKVSQLDRTRLKYDLTPEGMSVFTERAMQYAKDSLKAYKSFRQKARSIVSQLNANDVKEVYLDGDDEIMDILQLTCIEAGVAISDEPCKAVVKVKGQIYEIFFQ